MKSIILIITYFGKWPEWFPFYLESCRRNPTINWLFHTDCYFDSSDIPNISLKVTSKEDFINMVNERLDIKFPTNDLYKICDLRPMTGVLYEEEIRDYDFYGYGDIDLIYGNIRKFYTDKVLENNIISTHTWCISGHLALIKNEAWLRNAFRRIKNWKSIMETPGMQRFDEDIFVIAFKYPRWIPARLFFLYDLMNPFSIKYRRKLYFREQYTTPLTPSRWRNNSCNHPQVWFWKDGRITNEIDNENEYIYFHFMNYKYARYMDTAYGKTAFWDGLKNIIHLHPDEMRKGVRIDRYGFHAIDSNAAATRVAAAGHGA